MELQPCSATNQALQPLSKRRYLTLQSHIYVLHRHALAAKSLPDQLEKVLSIVRCECNKFYQRPSLESLFVQSVL